MALRDQPYFPLYVNDFLSDEKLNNCSAQSTGVYIRLMCLMHKSEKYGVFELREIDKRKYESQANFKQGSLNYIKIFASKLGRFMPYSVEEIETGLIELEEEGVITIDENCITQPRMVRDGEISSIRAKAGSAGGKAVRNSKTKKNYNESGYFYVAQDCADESCHKVGITKNLRNRLNGLRSQSQREMKYVFTAEVEDMGTTEDNVLTELNGIRDGEWIYAHPLSEIMKAVNKCVKITSKSQANPEIEIEYEYESENEIDNELNGDNGIRSAERKTVETSLRKNLDTSFERFWQAYPKKVGKTAAKKAFQKVDVPLETLLSAIERQKCGSQWSRDGGRYIPNPTTWLNQGRWEDEEYVPTTTAQTGNRVTTFYDVAEQMMSGGGFDDI